ncbi:MAG: choice-of-anchor E domain-containing protein [Planctomycetes bacterium]|nr:choice-of-anchor E domain-containing protein [Planctomycetota bacterium]
MILRSSFLLAGLLLGSPLALAGTQTHSFSLSSPPLSSPWATTIAVPKFDPALGHLTQVRITVSSSVAGTVGFENTGPSATSVSFNAGTNAVLSESNSFSLLTNPAYEVCCTSLPAFDGTLDFAGASGHTDVFTFATGTGIPSWTYTIFGPYGVDRYRGPQGAPGTITFDVSATASAVTNLGPSMAATAQISYNASVLVEYAYESGPTPICNGDSTQLWGPCPCGNFGGLGRGCANSVDASGAVTTASGTASISADTLQLTASSMPNSNAIFLQGDELTDTATPFGDGIRCVDGNLIRLGTSGIGGGNASYPAPAQLPIAVRGGVSVPGTRYYQTYYRNAAAYCTPATFNVTNGVAVLWTL